MQTLFDILKPIVRGELTPDAPMAAHSILGVGGAADLLFVPLDTDDLATALRALPASTPITVIGGGANILVRDGGIRGLTVLTARMTGEIKIDGTRVSASAGTRTIILSNAAADVGIAGFEFLCGIPGTLGGAVFGNAGAGLSGKDQSNIDGIGGIIESVDFVDHRGNAITLMRDQINFQYRRGNIPPELIVTRVNMIGTMGDPAEIRATMNALNAARRGKQPVGVRTCGSLFKNPPGDAAGRLIEAAGWRGRTVNGAMMSDVHANFLVNAGATGAAALENLARAVHDDVLQKFGIDLELELKIIGES